MRLSEALFELNMAFDKICLSKLFLARNLSEFWRDFNFVKWILKIIQTQFLFWVGFLPRINRYLIIWLLSLTEIGLRKEFNNISFGLHMFFMVSKVQIRLLRYKLMRFWVLEESKCPHHQIIIKDMINQEKLTPMPNFNIKEHKYSVKTGIKWLRLLICQKIQFGKKNRE